MADEITIRPAISKDIAVISAIIRESYRDVAGRFGLTPENCPKHPSNCSDGWIERDMARGVGYFLMEKNHRPVGCVALEKVDAALCYLERLSVLPEQRHKGYGRMLAEHVIDQAKQIGAQRISIGIMASDTSLKLWYGEIGFVEGETRAFAHLPFLVMFMEYDVRRESGVRSDEKI
jgi:GNAT superfamily N-acetyltransferase